jgi:hypothetical protein
MSGAVVVTGVSLRRSAMNTAAIASSPATDQMVALVAAAVLFSGLAAWRIRAPHGLRVAIAVLAITALVVVAPFWGNDFGAALSAVPAFALMVWLLLGRRITVRSVLGVIGVAVGGVLAIGLLDLVRPAEERTHVGKFLSQSLHDSGGATLVIRRKAAENLSVLGHSVLLVAVLVVVALVAYFWFVSPRRIRELGAHPDHRHSGGFVTAAALGFVLNDSGVTIPGIMWLCSKLHSCSCTRQCGRNHRHDRRRRVVVGL